MSHILIHRILYTQSPLLGSRPPFEVVTTLGVKRVRWGVWLGECLQSASEVTDLSQASLFLPLARTGRLLGGTASTYSKLFRGITLLC